MRRSIISVLLLLFLAFSIPDAFAQQTKAFQGRRLFVTYCYLCHGIDGKGDGPLAEKLKVPPPDLTDIRTVGKRTDDELQSIIKGDGHRPVSEAMPRWGKVVPKLIPEPQIKALVAYVRFISRSKNPLTGDPAVGEAIYKQYCSSCHGREGKGDGLMVELISIKPADHTNAARMDALTNEELTEIVSKGKGKESFMPGWKGILSESEIAAVVSYMRLLAH